MNPDNMLSLSQAALDFGISRNTLVSYIRKGYIVGNATNSSGANKFSWVSKVSLRDFINNGRIEGMKKHGAELGRPENKVPDDLVSKGYVSVKFACEKSGYSLSWLSRLCKKDAFGVERRGAAIFIHLEDLLGYKNRKLIRDVRREQSLKASL